LKNSISCLFNILKANKKVALAYSSLFFIFTLALLLADLSRTLRLILLIIFALSLFLVGFITKIETPLPFFGIIFFFYLSYLGKLAPRFGFIAAPAMALGAGLLFSQIIKLLWSKFKLNSKKVAIVMAIIVFVLILGLANGAAIQTKTIGSGLPGQWEDAMLWIKANTPADSVIAHWWDYGYWTQAVAERPSIQDGGKPGGGYYIYTLARYGMIGYDNTRSLEYFAAHNASYLLFSEEEIPKYHAFSFLGSDENNDRRSTIGFFKLQESREVRNGTALIYSGGWAFDQDLVIDNYILSEGKAIIAGFAINIDQENDINSVEAIIVHNNKQISEPISCIYTNENEIELDVESRMGGCIKFIPSIEKNQLIENNGLLYLSEKVSPGLFARLYILEENYPEFKLVYQDDAPLAIYGNNIIGPIKIWKINYPEGLKADPIFLAGDSDEFQQNYMSFKR